MRPRRKSTKRTNHSPSASSLKDSPRTWRKKMLWNDSSHLVSLMLLKSLKIRMDLVEGLRMLTAHWQTRRGNHVCSIYHVWLHFTRFENLQRRLVAWWATAFGNCETKLFGCTADRVASHKRETGQEKACERQSCKGSKVQMEIETISLGIKSNPYWCGLLVKNHSSESTSSPVIKKYVALERNGSRGQIDLLIELPGTFLTMQSSEIPIFVNSTLRKSCLQSRNNNRRCQF